MMKKLGPAIPLLTLLMFVAVAVAADLDGKTYEVTVVDPSGEALPDTLIFADGTFESVECRQYGFGAAPYNAWKEQSDGPWGFAVSTNSETEGVAHWKGTVKGDSISGTMTWVKHGQDSITYKFSGKLAS